MGDVLGDVELGPGLSGGGFSLTEVAEELGLGVTFEAFGDIGHDGNARSAQLVAETVVACEFALVGDCLDLAGQLAGYLPGADVFEAMDGGHEGRWNVEDK